MAGPRKSDYLDENDEVDWDAFYDAQADWGDMKYDQMRDDKMMQDMENEEKTKEDNEKEER